MTHFAEGSGEFITLEQFEREYFLYRQLLRFRTFVQFRLWKAFKVSAAATRTYPTHELPGAGLAYRY